METLHAIFAHVCGQVNLWSPGGETLPFCQRCTGLYLGGAWAMLAWLLARPRPTRRMLALHVAMLLLMVPFGYHWVEQGAVVRTLTGYLFAFGMVYFLALHPAHRFFLLSSRASESSRASRDAYHHATLDGRHPERAASLRAASRGTWRFLSDGSTRDALYLALLLLGAPSLLLALRFGGARTGVALAILGAAGLVIYGVLAAATLLSLLPLSRLFAWDES